MPRAGESVSGKSGVLSSRLNVSAVTPSTEDNPFGVVVHR